MIIKPAKHLAWSTEQVDLDDPFQRKWYIRQVLTHGRAEDIRSLDPDEVERLLDELDLPQDIYSLWSDFFEARRAAR